MIYNLHRIDNNNIGDYYCSPSHYYKFNDNIKLIDIHSNDSINIIPENSIIIVGGGGLLNCLQHWNDLIQLCKEKNNQLICWGAGFNTHISNSNCWKIRKKLDMKIFDLIGIRNKNGKYPYDFVPCVSCMLPQLKSDYKIKRRIGLYKHSHFGKTKENFDNIESLTNKEMNIDKVIEFLGTSEIILTNSYHGAYWGILLKKKVILCPELFSEKFYDMPYTVPIYSGNLENDILKTSIYENALTECININKDFYSKVEYFINNNKEL